MESKSKLWHFENFNILDVLSSEEKQAMSKMASMLSASKNQIIYFPEDASGSIYFLKQGKVKISKYSESGKEIILAILGPGELFGELGITDQTQQRKEFAEVTEDALICSLSIEELQHMLKANSNFNLQITKLIGLRLRKVQTRLESLCFKSAEDRIKNFILELSNDYGRDILGSGEKEIRLNLTHQDISKLTATSRQTVTSVMSELEKNGSIIYDRHRILIKEKKNLLV